MSGKFMRTKKIIIPTLTMLIIASQLVGCGVSNKEQAQKILENSTSIELEIAEPASIEQGELEYYTWEELGNLSDVPKLRYEWDKIFETKGKPGNKKGTIYYMPNKRYNNNNTLACASRNSDFMDIVNAKYEELGNAGELEYTDISDEDENVKLLMALNGYFNILQDGEPGFANPYETLTRAQVMAAVTRVACGPNDKFENTLDKVDKDNEYNLCASQYEKFAFLNSSNGLDKDSYNSKMTRGEAIHMIIRSYYNADYQVALAETVEAEFEDCSNAGDLIKSKGNAKDALKEMIASPEKGTDTTIFKSIEVARAKSIIDTGDTRWDEAITKVELIDMLFKAAQGCPLIKNFNNSDYSGMTQYDSSGAMIQNEETKAAAYQFFLDNFTPEHWGIATKGKTEADYQDGTGTTDYDPHVLKYGTTTKGYRCVYDINTKLTYYHGMHLPTGSIFLSNYNYTGDIVTNYIIDHMDDEVNPINSVYDIPYDKLVELYGKIDLSKGLYGNRIGNKFVDKLSESEMARIQN